MTTYVRTFAEQDEAERWMVMKNRAARDGSIFCVVDGPEDDVAVVDLRTAIELDGGYTWRTS